MSSEKTSPILDQYQRPVKDLRISVTDRCNFRCTYCMPKELFGADHAFLDRSNILSFEEIKLSASIFARLGVNKLRITGGEPLIRRELERLISSLRDIPGIDDISLTTNGVLLTQKKSQALFEAGIQRITISLDALDDHVFKKINDVNISVDKVLRAVDNALEAGLSPVKINMVVIKGTNDCQILPMARFFKTRYPNGEVILRFIEFMDVGSSNEWKNDHVLSSADVLNTLKTEFELEPVDRNYRGEVAQRWKYSDGGEIGLISSISQPFCKDCHRARLSAEGKIYTCLFASEGFDLREQLRSNKSVEDIYQQLCALWQARTDRYSEVRGQMRVNAPKIEMSYIGG